MALTNKRLAVRGPTVDPKLINTRTNISYKLIFWHVGKT